MKLNFPQTMPVWEQLIAASQRKRVGRKHNKTLGPGKTQKKNPDPRKLAAAKLRLAQIKAYYSGQRDEFPD